MQAFYNKIKTTLTALINKFLIFNKVCTTGNAVFWRGGHSSPLRFVQISNWPRHSHHSNSIQKLLNWVQPWWPAVTLIFIHSTLKGGLLVTNIRLLIKNLNNILKLARLKVQFFLFSIKQSLKKTITQSLEFFIHGHKL